jgi:hypothetical protein
MLRQHSVECYWPKPLAYPKKANQFVIVVRLDLDMDGLKYRRDPGFLRPCDNAPDMGHRLAPEKPCLAIWGVVYM